MVGVNRLYLIGQHTWFAAIDQSQDQMVSIVTSRLLKRSTYQYLLISVQFMYRNCNQQLQLICVDNTKRPLQKLQLYGEKNQNVILFIIVIIVIFVIIILNVIIILIADGTSQVKLVIAAFVVDSSVWTEQDLSLIHI